MECDAVFLACLHFVKAHGPHAELGQRQPQILDRTPHDARMAPRAPLVAVAQVRVRVELDDPECPEPLFQRRESAVGDGMLAAKQHGQPIAIENAPDRRFHPAEHGFRRTGNVDGWPRINARFGGDGFAIPQFELIGSLKNGFRAPRRPSGIRHRSLQRHGQHMEQAGFRFGDRQFRGKESVRGFVGHGNILFKCLRVRLLDTLNEFIIQITENIFPLCLSPRQHADMPCLLTRSAVFFSPPSERCWGPFCLC